MKNPYKITILNQQTGEEECIECEELILMTLMDGEWTEIRIDAQADNVVTAINELKAEIHQQREELFGHLLH